ncbi:MAG: HDOD domain-containing protein [Rhodospirillaceae bacterium]|nr:HDOD domain-containing protein [Rhodospirillaceae bacterium]
MTPPTRILFVDDDPMVLQGLKRALHRHHEDWSMRFCESAEDAFTEMNHIPADIVISDLRMPGMDGVQFLERVASLWPSTIRIILSGQTERETLLRAIGPAPQFLSKPCSAEHLETVISRSLRLRHMLNDPSFLKRIGQLRNLPSPPGIYSRLMEAIRNDKTPLDAVGRIIAQDIAFSTRLLQIANSPIFALPMTISNVAHATRLLGLDTIRAPALTHGLVSSLHGIDLGGLPIEALWMDGIQCGTVTRHMALNMRAPSDIANEAALAGMLHGIGQLLLAMNDPRRHRAARAAAQAGQLSLTEAEERLFGFNHALAGGYLLHLWGFPDAVVEGVIGWPFPSKINALPNLPTTADFVHIARVAMQLDRQGSDLPIEADDLEDSGADVARLVAFGAQNSLPQWIRSCPHLGHRPLP